MSSQEPAPSQPSATDPLASTSAVEAVQWVRERGAGYVIDVRTSMEVASQRIAGSRHIPLGELSKRIEDIKQIDGPCLLVCKTGKRAEAARQTLAQAGISNVVVVEGGISAYAEAGGEVVEERAGISLERQVRIAAGLLIVAAVTLGFLVHPGFHVLAGFVGAGLAFAGITDTCGMGLILARMPWNR